ncbi:MAG: DMT family transporter [Pirellulales bacterium]
MAYLAFLFVCCCWGSTFIVMERVSHALSPVEIGITRLLSAGLALSAIWWWKRAEYHLDRKHIPPILFSALVANVAPYVTQPYVLGQGYGHSFFGVVVAAIPLLTILFSIPMLGEWPTRRQLLGVVGGLVCLWFVIDDGFNRGMSWQILALAAVVPLTGSFNNTFVKRKLAGAQSLPVTAVMLGSAGLMLVPLELCRPAMTALDLAGPTKPEFAPQLFLYLAILGVVMTGLSTVAFFYMVFQRGPLFAGMTTYVVPLLAMAWGLFDHEQISTQQLVAMAGVFVMVGLVQSGSRSDEELTELLPEATISEVSQSAPSPSLSFASELPLVRPASLEAVPEAEAATYTSQCA